jgi:hypothetical protein
MSACTEDVQCAMSCCTPVQTPCVATLVLRAVDIENAAVVSW